MDIQANLFHAHHGNEISLNFNETFERANFFAN